MIKRMDVISDINFVQNRHALALIEPESFIEARDKD